MSRFCDCCMEDVALSSFRKRKRGRSSICKGCNIDSYIVKKAKPFHVYGGHHHTSMEHARWRQSLKKKEAGPAVPAVALKPSYRPQSDKDSLELATYFPGACKTWPDLHEEDRKAITALMQRGFQNDEPLSTFLDGAHCAFLGFVHEEGKTVRKPVRKLIWVRIVDFSGAMWAHHNVSKHLDLDQPEKTGLLPHAGVCMQVAFEVLNEAYRSGAVVGAKLHAAFVALSMKVLKNSGQHPTSPLFNIYPQLSLILFQFHHWSATQAQNCSGYQKRGVPWPSDIELQDGSQKLGLRWSDTVQLTSGASSHVFVESGTSQLFRDMCTLHPGAFLPDPGTKTQYVSVRPLASQLQEAGFCVMPHVIDAAQQRALCAMINRLCSTGNKYGAFEAILHTVPNSKAAGNQGPEKSTGRGLRRQCFLPSNPAMLTALIGDAEARYLRLHGKGMPVDIKDQLVRDFGEAMTIGNVVCGKIISAFKKHAVPFLRSWKLGKLSGLCSLPGALNQHPHRDFELVPGGNKSIWDKAIVAIISIQEGTKIGLSLPGVHSETRREYERRENQRIHDIPLGGCGAFTEDTVHFGCGNPTLGNHVRLHMLFLPPGEEAPTTIENLGKESCAKRQ